MEIIWNGLFLFRASVHWSKNISRKFLVHRPLQIVVKLRHMKNNSNFTQNLSNQMRYYILSLISRKNSSKQIPDLILFQWMFPFHGKFVKWKISRWSCCWFHVKKFSDDIAILWGSRKILIPPSYLFSWKMQFGRYEHPHYYNFLKMSNAKFW